MRGNVEMLITMPGGHNGCTVWSHVAFHEDLQGMPALMQGLCCISGGVPVAQRGPQGRLAPENLPGAVLAGSLALQTRGGAEGA